MTPLFKVSDLLAEQTTAYLRQSLAALSALIEQARERDDLATLRSLRRSRRQVAAELLRREGDDTDE